MYATTSPGRVASHSKDPLWFPNTSCLIRVVAGHLHSQWSRSCSSKWHFEQTEYWDGLSSWRYCLREGWWPGRRKASSTSSFLLLICFAPRETFWCVGGSLRVLSFITWIELENETGKTVSVVMEVATLAAMSCSSLSWMVEWPEIHLMKMEDEMEFDDLMNWERHIMNEEVRGFDELRASHNDLFSLQKSTETEGWLALVDVQDNSDSMTAASSS